ncbi:MAG TPA: hypothetical protein VGB37_14025 [Candidatus Lokiarchaeia archaeon]
MENDNLSEGWTQDKIDNELERQYKNGEFYCSEGCDWVVGECKHNTFGGKMINTMDLVFNRNCNNYIIT